jgi:hypothetical protein
MADNGFGVSFLPNGDSRYQRPGEDTNPGSNIQPVQDAIKILSLRVPRVVGANPLAPLALLQGRGGGGLSEGLLQQLLRTMGQMPATNAGGPRAGVGGVGVGGAPSPFAAPEGAAPASPFGNGAPPVRVQAGGNAAPPNIPQTTQATPHPRHPVTPFTSPLGAGQYAWSKAQQSRTSMGRVLR